MVYLIVYPDYKHIVVRDEDDLEMEELAEQQKEAELGRGNRARKEVTYQEQLSERDWLKAIGAEDDEDDEDDYDTPKKSKGKKKKKRNGDESDDEPKKKKKKGHMKRILKKMKKLMEVNIMY